MNAAPDRRDERSTNSARTPKPRSTRSVIMFVLGLAMVALAVWAAVRSSSGADTPAPADAWRVARDRPWALHAGAVLLPTLNWLLVSSGFWVLTVPLAPPGRDPVRFGEMAALTGSAWLLNYLPFKAGMLGRVAYHRTVNGIAIADSVRVLAISIAAAGVAVGLLVGVAWIIRPAWGTSTVLAALGAPAIGFLLATAALRLREVRLWRYAACITARYFDVLVWTARYAVVFALIGQPLTLAQAAAVSAVSQVVLVIPFTGNALGLREWAVGWAAASLPAWFGTGDPGRVSTGLSADLIHRVYEVATSMVVGVVCTAIVARRVRRMTQACPRADGKHDAAGEGDPERHDDEGMQAG